MSRFILNYKSILYAYRGQTRKKKIESRDSMRKPVFVASDTFSDTQQILRQFANASMDNIHTGLSPEASDWKDNFFTLFECLC
jgi:poly-D-alanine transfer protein DltD